MREFVGGRYGIDVGIFNGRMETLRFAESKL
jgi:hypothetical protein